MMKFLSCTALRSFASIGRKSLSISSPQKFFHSHSVVQQATNNNSDDELLDEEAWKSFKFGPTASRGSSKMSSLKSESIRKDNPKEEDKEEEELKTVSALDPMWMHLSDEEISRGNKILEQFASADRIEKFRTILNQRSDAVRFVFENPSNPNNLWAALRTFDSFGIQFVDIILQDGSSEWETLRKGRMSAALGSQKWLTLQQHSNTTACFDRLKAQGYTILASDLHSQSVSLSSIDQSWVLARQQLEKGGKSEGNAATKEMIKVALVMGNEVTGITEEARQAADQLVHIPMKGFAESFNLSVAAALFCSQLQHAGLLTNGNLSVALQHRLLFSWYLKSVKGSLSILRRHAFAVTGHQVHPKIGNISTKP